MALLKGGEERMSGLLALLRHHPAVAVLATAAVLALLMGADVSLASTDTPPTMIWTQEHPATSPPPRYLPAVSYDAAHHQVVLFGGMDPWTGGLNDTWTWDGVAWARRRPATAPTPRDLAAMAYDPDMRRVILFGGGQTSETWAWDGTTWIQLHPSTSPPSRDGAAMAYDAATHTIALFGGNYSGLSDTWTWDGTTWAQQAPATYPPPLKLPGMTYDAGLGKVLLFGGGIDGARGNDLWTWDGATWRQEPVAGVPPPAGVQLLAYDAAVSGDVLLSGDPWAGAPPTATWTLHTPPSSPPVPRDDRYFGQTGYRVDNDAIWDYFNRRGGVPTFGYPTSRAFTFQGFEVQFFQRRTVQLALDGSARQLNLLDAGLVPYTSFNGSTFPGVEPNLVAQAPDPTDQPATLAFVKQHAPDSYQGAPVNFYRTFIDTVTPKVAFPDGEDPSLVPGIDFEMWGIPTSGPLVDPTNHTFISLRWQRGIMMYDGSRQVTEAVLLADYLKAILTGGALPADVDREAQASPFYRQYDPSRPKWVRDPGLLPDTDLTDAFSQE